VIAEREDLIREAMAGINGLASYQRRAISSSHTHFRDISRPQTYLLMILQERGPQTVSELADLLAVSAPSASSLLDRLEERGLVQRTRDAADRRVVHVEVTEGGRTLLDEMAGVKRDHIQRLLSLMDEDDLHAIIGGLDALQRAFEKMKSADCP